MASPRQIEHDDSEAVTAFLRGLDHPMKAVMEIIRTTILSADRNITEGIKWNTASFYSSGWFATINVPAKADVQLILHHGAKVREGRKARDLIEDPAHLLTWLADDRASVTFPSANDLRNKREAFKSLIKAWVKCQPAQ